MSDPKIDRLNKTIIGLTAMVQDAKYSNLALERVLKELMTTMTVQQQEIIKKLPEYKKEMLENGLISLEKENPRLAALLSSILSGDRPL